MKRFEVETIELKPCPFCGGKAGIYSIAKYEKEAYCENCGAVSNICMTEEEAVEAWNRRDERTCGEWRGDSRQDAIGYAAAHECDELWCEHCDIELDDGWCYCPNCGAKVVEQ